MGSIVSRAANNSNNNKVNCWVPEDIIRCKILPRLPVKSLITFRCVCKSWNNFLTQDPEFVKAHITHHSNNDALMLRCVPYVNYPEFHPLMSKDLRLGGSVNGLVCVYHQSWRLRSITCIGIWNPATNQYKDIPIPPRAIDIPGKYAIDFGIGFNPIANDYKLIFTITYGYCPFVADVYSCNADSWGNNSVTSTFVSRGGHECPVIVRGRPYWYHLDVDSPDFNSLVCFDVQDEVFLSLPGMKFINLNIHSAVVVNLRDSLAVMVHDFPQAPSRLVDVYFLDESSGLWTKNYMIGPITIPKSLLLLNCFRNGDLFFAGNKYVKLVGIDPETHVTDRFASGMYAYDNSRCKIRSSYSFDYKETLVSVKGMYLLHVGKVGIDVMIVDRSF